jgi:catechol 2,3-dioxygenase-like lactoylglutathione lyase family enzyme
MDRVEPAAARLTQTYGSSCDDQRNPPHVCDHGITHIALDVRDIHAEYERLSAAGMRFHCPPLDMGGIKATYGRDPDGNVVELQEILTQDSPVALGLK